MVTFNPVAGYAIPVHPSITVVANSSGPQALISLHVLHSRIRQICFVSAPDFLQFPGLFSFERSEDKSGLTRRKKPRWLRQSLPPTTQKQNERINQVKTSNNTKPARRRHLPSLALLLTAVTLLAFAPQPACAGPSYPFHARFTTEFESVVEFPYLHLWVNGQGRATYMGPTTAMTTDQMVSMLNGSATATYTLTADSLAGVRADTLILAMAFQATDVPGGVTFTGSYTVTGGTGRFAGATGSGVVAGSALLVGSNNGIGSFSLSGGISGPGE